MAAAWPPHLSRALALALTPLIGRARLMDVLRARLHSPDVRLLTLIGPAGARLRAWEFIDAFPVKWRGPEFAADSNEAATEQLEIAHHGFRAKKP